MRTPTMLIGLLLVLGTSSVSAQDVISAYRPGDAVVPARVPMMGPAQGPEAGLIAIEPFDVGPPVKDAPYTAEAVTETTHVLADGNRIEQRTSGTVARDGQGRVRRQQQAMAFGGLIANSDRPLVTISDPAGTHVTLDPESRVASRIKTPAPPLPGPGELAAAVPPRGTDALSGKRAMLRWRMGTPPVVEGERVLAMRRRAESAPPAMPGTDVKTEQLEARLIEGVRAEGTRTTMTIEANAIGNQLPITIVSERWYSPDLQVVVLSRRSDPRFGETTYRLINIVRGEPSPDLFEVPSDYRIEDQPLPPRVRRKPPVR